MSREVKRVALDFNWPLKKIWEGFLVPRSLKGAPCAACDTSGRTHFGRWLEGFTYVMAMLAGDVAERARGRDMHPWLIEFARAQGHHECQHNGKWVPLWQVEDDDSIEVADRRRMPSRWVIDRPGTDTQRFFHGIMRSHYALRRAQDGGEYAHLYAEDKLPPAEEVGSSLGSSSNGTGTGNLQWALMNVLLDAAGIGEEPFDVACPFCHGQGRIETYEGQFAEREAWEPHEPPEGDGWQFWETVSEGSPLSPVFGSAEELAQWCTTPAVCWGAMSSPMTIEQARAFVGKGWAPSVVATSGGVHAGADFVGTEEVLAEHETEFDEENGQ